VLWAAISAFPSVVHAQVVADNRDVPGEAERRTLRTIERGSEAARDGVLLPGERVSLEQILADPDNLDLNYRFAQTQIAEGDLRGAMSTLERILLTRPDLARIRLLYAVVLFRLDNTDEAERELKTLRDQEMPESLRVEIDDALRQIDRRQRSTRFAANLTIGGQFNTNRDAAPDSNKRVAGGLVFASADGRADAGLLAIASLELNHDLGLQSGHEFFARASGFMAEQSTVDAQDLLAGFLETGFLLRTDWAEITPSFNFGSYNLAGDHFLDTYSGKVDVRRRLNDHWTAYVSNELQYQDYDAVRRIVDGASVAALAPERTGIRNETQVGALYMVTPQHQLRGTLSFSVKDAKESFNSYQAVRAELSHTWLLGRGMFLVSTASAAWQPYNDPDTRISAREREDVTLLGRVAFGVPFETLWKETTNYGVGDVVLGVAAQLTHQDSNITNYTYTDLSGQVLLSKRWEF
jgi:hypothetical protein